MVETMQSQNDNDNNDNIKTIPLSVHAIPSSVKVNDENNNTINIQFLPDTVTTTRGFRTRVRKAVRQILTAFEIETPEVLKKKNDAIQEFFKSRFMDMDTTELAFHSIVITMNDDKSVDVVWTTKQHHASENEKQSKRLHKLRKMLQMKRSRNIPDEWQTYFQLEKQWKLRPPQQTKMFPLEDPDTIREQKEMFMPMVEVYTQMMNMRQHDRGDGNLTVPKNSLMSLWINYIESCVKDQEG